MIQKIEIDFPIAVNMSVEAQTALNKAIEIICKEYEENNPGRVMWTFAHGCKPTYIPMTAEEEKHRGIEFDKSIFHMEIAERQGHQSELERRKSEGKNEDTLGLLS
jgi:hypothetical protein